MSDDEERVLVCIPVSHGEPVVKSITLICDRCGTPVWASVAMQEDPEVRAMSVRCAPCMFPNGITGKDIAEGEVHPIALREAAEYFQTQGRKEKDDA